MHNRQRRHRFAAAWAIVLTCAGSASVFTAAVLSTERLLRQDEIEDAMRRASQQQTTNMHLRGQEDRSRQTQAELERLVPSIARDKRDVRLQLGELRDRWVAIKKETGVNIDDPAVLAAAVTAQRERVAVLIREIAHSSHGSSLLTFVRDTFLYAALEAEHMLQRRALLRGSVRILRLLTEAQTLPAQMQLLEQKHRTLLDEYVSTDQRLTQAQETERISAARQTEIRRIVAQVQAEILELQSEMERIDARIKRRAERDLIDKGLLDAKEGAYTSGAIAKGVKLLWPAVGPISAGYLNHAYEEFFGVPHRGIDIVVPQGTAVVAAADGVVYLARDGGATGYSYILIGHRGGTATLYGHVSEISVTMNQDVRRGQIIGKSGGIPGTNGAGPMTTGAHLHFEVIQSGVHVDPLTILP